MTDQFPPLTEQEQKAVIHTSILAAFADGNVAEPERTQIKRIAERFVGPGSDLTLFYQDALAGRSNFSGIVNQLQSANGKALAYEMAVCICNADGSLTESEGKFLGQLRQALNLDPQSSATFDRNAAQLRDQPPVIAKLPPVAPAGLDEMIRDRAILTGALEIMPHRLATMAIVPVQMRMVYQISKAFGYTLDLSHTKEFFATVGVGLTSQVVEGYLSSMVRHLARPFVGGFLASLASQAAESAIAFATTYALGQVAKTYYGGGRTLSSTQLRDLFSTMLNEGRSMQARYSSQISQRASSLKPADLLAAA